MSFHILAETAKHFRTIPGFPGYVADIEGRVWSCWSPCRVAGSNPRTTITRRSANWRRLSAAGVASNGYLVHHMKSVGGGLRGVTAHRAVLMAFTGSDRPGLDARHKNGVRIDNRPENLEWGTRAENVADSRRHGTIARGETNGHARLTEADVREIRHRKAAGERAAALAAEYGVAQLTINDVVARRRWAHIP